MFKYNNDLLKKIEDIFGDAGYTVRYEKGNFQSGWCILEQRKVVVVNKFHQLDTRINSLMEILVQVDINTDELSHESLELLQKVRAEKADALFA